MIVVKLPFIGIVKEYFHSWRDYNCILERLHHVHGVRRSLPWLKLKLKQLGLKKRGVDVDINTVKTVIRKILRTSDNCMGYRGIWKVLRDRYKLFVKRFTTLSVYAMLTQCLFRDVVMELMRELDGEGVEMRRKRSLTRRVYFSKVYIIFLVLSF